MCLTVCISMNGRNYFCDTLGTLKDGIIRATGKKMVVVHLFGGPGFRCITDQDCLCGIDLAKTALANRFTCVPVSHPSASVLMEPIK